MAKLPLILSVLAAALAGWAAWTASSPPAPREGGLAAAALEARLEALERVLGDRAPEAPKAASLADPGAESAAGMSSSGAAGTPTLVGSPRSSATLSEIERRLAKVEEVARKAESSLAERERAGPGGAQTIELGGPGHDVTMPTFYGSVADAAKDLELTPSQSSDFERVVADAKREMDDLKKIPDETGTTWEQAQKDTFKVTDGGFSLDLSKMQAFREKVIPGRSESFGTAERRIRENAKRRLRDGLTRDQQGKFDKAQSDGLVGGGDGGFGGVMFSTSVFTTDEPPAMDK